MPSTLLGISRKTYHERRAASGLSDIAKVPEIKGFFEVAPIVSSGFCLAAATSLGYWPSQ
jgi:hypothetical protein